MVAYGGRIREFDRKWIEKLFSVREAVLGWGYCTQLELVRVAKNCHDFEDFSSRQGDSLSAPLEVALDFVLWSEQWAAYFWK